MGLDSPQNTARPREQAASLGFHDWSGYNTPAANPIRRSGQNDALGGTAGGQRMYRTAELIQESDDPHLLLGMHTRSKWAGQHSLPSKRLPAKGPLHYRGQDARWESPHMAPSLCQDLSGWTFQDPCGHPEITARMQDLHYQQRPAGHHSRDVPGLLHSVEGRPVAGDEWTHARQAPHDGRGGDFETERAYAVASAPRHDIDGAQPPGALDEFGVPLQGFVGLSDSDDDDHFNLHIVRAPILQP
jgi:hypothetical protein